MKRLTFFLIPLLAVGGAVALLFEAGYLRFNYPERGRFPVQGIDASGSENGFHDSGFAEYFSSMLASNVLAYPILEIGINCEEGKLLIT